MKSPHAVIHLSHQSARVVEFEDQRTGHERIEQRAHVTRQHASGVRSEHEFFASVCDRLDGFAKVLITGGHTPLADFQRYVETHRPPISARIAGYEVVDQLTDNQLAALASKRFDAFERLA